MEPIVQQLLKDHVGGVTILVLCLLVMGTLLVLVPQLLKSRQRQLEMIHLEHMRALEQGLPIPQTDERSHLAGRVAVLVPIIVVISAATVTCFLVGYHSENTFAVALAVWSVAAVIGLAAITGGVALVGRLAQIEADSPDEDVPANPMLK